MSAIRPIPAGIVGATIVAADPVQRHVPRLVAERRDVVEDLLPTPRGIVDPAAPRWFARPRASP